MRKRPFLGLLFLGSLVATAIVGACADPTPPDVATYGPPNGIGGKVLPDPPGASSSSGGTGSSSSGSGTSSSGTGSSSGSTAQVLCQQQGGTLVPPDGGCAVSFTNDLYVKMQAGGALNCGTVVGCHGSGALPPDFSGKTAAAYYNSLVNYTIPNVTPAVPYVNPCSTDPTKSQFVCNTSATNTCSIIMPSSSGAAAAATADIATWVACGAPFN